MKLIEPLALGQLNLHPWEFMRYTPREIIIKIEKYGETKKADRRFFLQSVAHLMNSTGNYKEKITVATLTGEKPVSQQVKSSEADMQALRKRFGG